MKKIVTIGGGNGHAQVLRALKVLPDVRITGICPSTDSGGSTGILQREYEGAGYTGDLTRCILALCDDEEFVAALMYRYENGPLHGHTVRNLFFHALEKVGDTNTALTVMWRVCGLGGHRVLPVTTEKTELCATLQMGNVVFGETQIDMIAKNPLWSPDVHSISDIHLQPSVSASTAVLEAVGAADTVIVCPGDLYSSILPVLLPEGMKEAISTSSAKIVVVLNIMTKKGETDNYTAEDFIMRIEERLGRAADYILYNNAPLPEAVRALYSLERKVELVTEKGAQDPRIIACPIAEVTAAGQVVSSAKAMREVLAPLCQ